MDNHRRHRHRRGHHISSFNPACCFGPSPPKEPSPKRTTCTTTATSSRPKQMRLLRFGSMSAALTSPRIGCLGQIKRNKPSSNSHKSSSTATTTSSSSSSSSTTSSSSSLTSKSEKLLKSAMALLPSRPSSRVGVSVSFVEDMDPPLPVLRRPARDANLASLWQRRCSGGAGETNRGLQVELPQQQLCAVVL